MARAAINGLGRIGRATLRILMDTPSSALARSPGARTSTLVDGDLIKVMSWYDNEWGNSNQLVREAVRIATEMDARTVKVS